MVVARDGSVNRREEQLDQLTNLILLKEEIRIPRPMTPEWADTVSKAFRDYFMELAKAKEKFASAIGSDDYDYIASVGRRDHKG